MTGAGLDASGLAITLGSAPCTITGTPTATSATCVTGAHSAGTVAATVSTSLGSQTLPNAYTYVAVPPTFPPTPVVAPGKPGKFRESGGPRAKKFTFAWDQSAHATADTRYDLTIHQRGRAKVLVRKTTARLTATVTRNAIVKAWRKSLRARGDVGAQYLRLTAKLAARTGSDKSPTATTHFRIRL